MTNETNHQEPPHEWVDESQLNVSCGEPSIWY